MASSFFGSLADMLLYWAEVLRSTFWATLSFFGGPAQLVVVVVGLLVTWVVLSQEWGRQFTNSDLGAFTATCVLGMAVVLVIFLGQLMFTPFKMYQTVQRELAKRVPLRRLAYSDMAAMREALEDEKPSKIGILYPPSDREAMRLAEDLEAVFGAAGWETLLSGVSDIPAEHMHANVVQFIQFENASPPRPYQDLNRVFAAGNIATRYEGFGGTPSVADVYPGGLSVSDFAVFVGPINTIAE